jgi:hypothetical protein
VGESDQKFGENCMALQKLYSLYKYICINEVKGDAIGVIHGVGVKDEKGIPSVSGAVSVSR